VSDDYEGKPHLKKIVDEEFNMNFPKGVSPEFVNNICKHICKLGYRGVLTASSYAYVKVKFFKEGAKEK